jgi:hypothetical protein
MAELFLNLIMVTGLAYALIGMLYFLFFVGE